MLAALVFLTLATAAIPQSGKASADYANDLCSFHNRFSTRVACSHVASSLQSANADPQQVDRLTRLLRTGDHRGALRVADTLLIDLQAGPPSARAALQYVRSAMLDLEDSDGAIAAAKDACSLDAYKMYCLAYASKLLSARETAAARSLYREILQKFSEPEHPDADPLFRARVLLALSVTTEGPNINSESKRLLEQAKATLHDAHPNNEDDRTRLLAAILDSIASHEYRFDRQLDAALKTYNQELALHERLALKYPRAYRVMVAEDLDSLASVYLDMGKRQDAEKLLRQALDIYEKIARTDPGAGEIFWSRTAEHYARLFTEQQPDESERVYQHTLQQVRRLAKQMPEAYEPSLADLLDDMWQWYSEQDLHPETLEIAQEEYSVSKRLWERNPKRHGFDLSNASYHLAMSLYRTGEPASSSCPYLEEAFSVAPDLQKATIRNSMDLFECH
ncbi:MAG: tetratricopeptide repeat protein [Bryobacteraceae bacterium]